MSDLIDMLRAIPTMSDEDKKIILLAAERIEKLERNFVIAENEVRIADINKSYFQKEFERVNAISESRYRYISKLENAMYEYISTVSSNLGVEGVAFIDKVEEENARLISTVFMDLYCMKHEQ